MSKLTPAHWIIIVVVLLCFGYFFFKTVDNGLVALVVGVVHYFTGTTESSKAKDATIAAQLPSPTNPPNSPV